MEQAGQVKNFELQFVANWELNVLAINHVLLSLCNPEKKLHI